MNSLERVTLALQHKEADRIPVYPLINSVSRKALEINYEEWTTDVEKCAESIIKASEEIGVDCLCTLVDLSVEAADWGRNLNLQGTSRLILQRRSLLNVLMTMPKSALSTLEKLIE